MIVLLKGLTYNLITHEEGRTLTYLSDVLSKKKDCFPILALPLYNALPPKFKMLCDRTFKRNLENWLKMNSLYSLYEYYRTSRDMTV